MEEVSTIKTNIYKEGSPVVISSGTLNVDEDKAYAVLVFNSISSLPINDILIDLHVFDRANIEIEVIRDYVYITDSLKRGESFGGDFEIPISSSSSKTISVAIRKVSFEDESVWTGSNSILFENIPDIVSLDKVFEDKELIEQFQRDFKKSMAKIEGVKAEVVPFEYKDLWICSCKGVNHKDEEECYICNASFMPQKEYLQDKEQIISNLEEYKKDLEEKARIAKEEAIKKAEAERLAKEEAERREQERLYAEKVAAAKRKARRITIIVTSAILAVIIVVFIYILNTFLIPENRYNAALALMESGEYDNAITAFSALGEYSDSKDKIIEAKYQKGQSELSAGNYETAVEIFTTLTESRDVADDLNEANYQIAQALYNEGNFIEALSAFEKVEGYKDSSDIIGAISFELAKIYINDGNVEQVVTLSIDLSAENALTIQEMALSKGSEVYASGEHDFAKSYFNLISDENLVLSYKEIYYQHAVELIISKSYDEAVAILNTILDYSDVPMQLKRIDYDKGHDLLAAGSYAEAIAQFELAADYPGATDSINEVNYILADIDYSNANYADALAKYQALGTYKESANLALETQYQLGVTQLNAGQVMDSYNTLYPIKHYNRAFTLLVTNSQYYIHVYDVNKGSNPLYEG